MLKKALIKDADKNITGNEITASTLKNRVYPPFQEATINIDYQKGIQPYAGLIDLGIKAGIITKGGSWYSYGDVKLGQGADKATESLKDYPQVLEDINTWLETTKYSSVNENLKAAEDALAEVLKNDKEEENSFTNDEEDVINVKKKTVRKRK
jgi:hypothetical protein